MTKIDYYILISYLFITILSLILDIYSLKSNKNSTYLEIIISDERFFTIFLISITPIFNIIGLIIGLLETIEIIGKIKRN